jgi:hypothetical protein
MMAAFGLAQPAIAAVFGVADRTLRTRCKTELAIGLTEALTAVANALFKSAIRGNVDAQKFFLRCRGRWVDPIPSNSCFRSPRCRTGNRCPPRIGRRARIPK